MKRLFLLIGLLLGFAASGWAETDDIEFDTIYFEFEPTDDTEVGYFSFNMPAKFSTSHIKIDWCDGEKHGSYPSVIIDPPYTIYNDSWGHFRVKGKGYWKIYYPHAYDNSMYSLKIEEGNTFGASIWIRGNNIKITSLEVHGSYLRNLDCNNLKLTDLNASNCSSLTELQCNNNQLTNLDISGCTALTSLNCNYNELTNLDVSNCISLIKLACSYNQLTYLDVSGLTALTTLYCFWDNPLKHLNVSKCSALTSLDCHNNQLTSLEINGCSALETITKLSMDTLKIHGAAMYNLSLSSSIINVLDVSESTTLTRLSCYSNQMSNLYARGNTTLTSLYCYNNNQVTNLDVNECSALTSLTYIGGNVTKLNASGCSALKRLSCYSDKLKDLDISGCSALSDLYCPGNQLTYLDVSDCISLEKLDCDNNQLSSLDISGCPKLRSLRASENHIPLSILYRNRQLSRYQFIAEHQSDTITIRSNQPLDLSSERILGNSISTFEISDISGQAIPSGSYSEDNFIFRFQNLGQYMLTLQNSTLKNKSEQSDAPINGTPITFSLIISVVDELPVGYVTTQVNPNNSAWGKAMTTGYGTYKAGTEITITATPQDGNRFINWTKENGEVFSTEAEYTFTATEDLNLTANFEEMFTINLSANNPDFGSVSLTGIGRYTAGTEVTITATPQEGGKFINWTKENGEVFSTEAEYTFAVMENLELTANFEEMFTVNLSANNPDFGSVYLTGNGRYTAGTEITITATPQEGGRFINWTKENGEVFSTEAEYTFTVRENLELTANFEEIPEKETFLIVLSTSDQDRGSIGTSSNNWWYQQRYEEYEKGTEITIRANPYSGYRFLNWTKADGSVFSTEVEYTFTVTENLELTANFAEYNFTLEVYSNNPNCYVSDNYINITKEGLKVIELYVYYDPVYYRFINWTKQDGSIFSTEEKYTLVLTENLKLTANFEEKETFTVNLYSNNSDWGYAYANNDYILDGEDLTIYAYPYDGYHFVNWTKADGSEFSTEAEYTFEVTENLDLTANFAPNGGGGVGNESHGNDNFAIYVQDHTIRLSEARGAVQVFNTAGQCIYNGSSSLIPVPNGGVYIVKVGARNYKVIVQ